MTTLAIMGYGALGGLLGYVVLFATPELRKALDADDFTIPSFPKVVVLSLLAATYVLIGGCAAPLFGAAEVKDAILYGVAGEGLFAGVVKSQ
jgi:hypothetical protein